MSDSLGAPGFHHLHLNSVDPDAAIDFYTRQFPTLGEDALGRSAGAQGAKQRPDPVHQGRDPARDVAADRDLALRLARPGHPRPPRDLPRPAGRPVPAALHRGRRRRGVHQQRHVARQGRRARPDAGADRRRQGHRRAADPQRRLRLHARAPTTPSWSTPATIRPSASTTCTCTRKTRSARSSGTRSTCNAPVYAGRTSRTPLTEATCQVARGPDRTWPALEPEGMFRTPAAAVEFDDVAFLWYMRQGTSRSRARAGMSRITSRSASPISTPGSPSCAARASGSSKSPTRSATRAP